MLVVMLEDVASRIAEVDNQQSSDDAECGRIEGKLEAYREFARSISKMIDEVV